MEEQLRINWPAVVEAAKQKRKTLKLTQQRLAELAGVSAPTVSHFENGQKDIQLSTITRILGVLGMLDERVLIFPRPGRRATIPVECRFGSTDVTAEKTVRCAISDEALEDHFGDTRRSSANVSRQPRKNREARHGRKYLAGDVKPDGSVLHRIDGPLSLTASRRHGQYSTASSSIVSRKPSTRPAEAVPSLPWLCDSGMISFEVT